MTAREVYTRAIAFLMEKPDEDKVFLDNAVKLINAGLAELAATQKSRNPNYENSTIAELSDTIPMDEELCEILPLYLASHFMRDDLDRVNSDIFYGRFIQARENLKKVNFSNIEDVYGGEYLAD